MADQQQQGWSQPEGVFNFLTAQDVEEFCVAYERAKQLATEAVDGPLSPDLIKLKGDIVSHFATLDQARCTYYCPVFSEKSDNGIDLHPIQLCKPQAYNEYTLSVDMGTDTDARMSGNDVTDNCPLTNDGPSVAAKHNVNKRKKLQDYTPRPVVQQDADTTYDLPKFYTETQKLFPRRPGPELKGLKAVNEAIQSEPITAKLQEFQRYMEAESEKLDCMLLWSEYDMATWAATDDSNRSRKFRCGMLTPTGPCQCTFDRPHKLIEHIATDSCHAPNEGEERRNMVSMRVVIKKDGFFIDFHASSFYDARFPGRFFSLEGSKASKCVSRLFKTKEQQKASKASTKGKRSHSQLLSSEARGESIQTASAGSKKETETSQAALLQFFVRQDQRETDRQTKALEAADKEREHAMTLKRMDTAKDDKDREERRETAEKDRAERKADRAERKADREGWQARLDKQDDMILSLTQLAARNGGNSMSIAKDKARDILRTR